MCWNCTGIIFQIVSTINPATERIFVVNQIYNLNSILVFVLFYLAFYKKKTYLYYFVFILMNIRHAIRLFDFEGTRDLAEDGEIK